MSGGGVPIKALFAADGVHPNGAGCGTLQAGFQQALSVSTMLERAVSRRTRRLAALPWSSYVLNRLNRVFPVGDSPIGGYRVFW